MMLVGSLLLLVSFQGGVWGFHVIGSTPDQTYGDISVTLMSSSYPRFSTEHKSNCSINVTLSEGADKYEDVMFKIEVLDFETNTSSCAYRLQFSNLLQQDQEFCTSMYPSQLHMKPKRRSRDAQKIHMSLLRIETEASVKLKVKISVLTIQGNSYRSVHAKGKLIVVSCRPLRASGNSMSSKNEPSSHETLSGSHPSIEHLPREITLRNDESAYTKSHHQPEKPLGKPSQSPVLARRVRQAENPNEHVNPDEYQFSDEFQISDDQEIPDDLMIPEEQVVSEKEEERRRKKKSPGEKDPSQVMNPLHLPYVNAMPHKTTSTQKTDPPTPSTVGAANKEWLPPQTRPVDGDSDSNPAVPQTRSLNGELFVDEPFETSTINIPVEVVKSFDELYNLPVHNSKTNPESDSDSEQTPKPTPAPPLTLPASLLTTRRTSDRTPFFLVVRQTMDPFQQFDDEGSDGSKPLNVKWEQPESNTQVYIAGAVIIILVAIVAVVALVINKRRHKRAEEEAAAALEATPTQKSNVKKK